MVSLVGGIAVLAVTSLAFWSSLPRDGKVSRFVGGVWEPLVGVFFCSGFALGLAMILSSVLGVAAPK